MHLKLYAFYSMHLFLYTSFNPFLSMNFLLSISLYVFYSMHFTYPINHLLYAFISMLTFHYYYFVTLLIFIKSFVIFKVSEISAWLGIPFLSQSKTLQFKLVHLLFSCTYHHIYRTNIWYLFQVRTLTVIFIIFCTKLVLGGPITERWHLFFRPPTKKKCIFSILRLWFISGICLNNVFLILLYAFKL